MAFQNPVVKNQVNEVPVVADEHPFLAGFETKTVAQFEQETLQVVNERLFEVAFRAEKLFGQPSELEKIRRTEKIGGLQRLGLLVGAAEKFFLVVGQPGALEKQGFDLPLQLPDRPAAPDAFDFVEGTLEGVSQVRRRVNCVYERLASSFSAGGLNCADGVCTILLD